MRSRAYSRVSRSWMISRWSRPRNPQRKPKPSAALLSVSNEKLASLRRSLLMLSRSFSKSAASTGNRPQNTTGWTSFKPGGGPAGRSRARPGGVRGGAREAAGPHRRVLFLGGWRGRGGALAGVGDGVADAGLRDFLD